MNQYRSHYQTSHRWEKFATVVLAIVIGLIYAVNLLIWCMP